MVSNSLAWPIVGTLFRVQKVIPLVAISRVLLKYRPFYIMEMFIVLSALVGALAGVTHTRLRKILAYSSIRHRAWLYSGLTVSHYSWFFYLVAYSLRLLPLVLWVRQEQLGRLTHRALKRSLKRGLVLRVNLLSLGAYPLLLGLYLRC